MSFDQSIQYRVSIDDADFQSKLSQMRASMDATLGGAGGFGGMGSMPGMLSMMGPRGFGVGATDMMMSGLADFGSQIRPVSYTPPAIAMQPHFGMFAMQQSGFQSMLGSLGPAGLGVQGAANIFNGRDIVPQQMTAADYMQLSARSFGTRLGDAAATAGLVTAGTALGMATGGMGKAFGEMIGGTFGGLALGLVGGVAASAYTSAVGDMMADNRGIQTQLEAGSFRFITSGKDFDTLTGRGFGRGARAEVADAIQTMELNDNRFGMGEMKHVLEAGMQYDMFSGSTDVESFKGKFKGLVDNIKTITAVLHTSLKDGMEVIRGFRDMGITDPSQIGQAAFRSDALGRMSGRTGMEMMAIGQTGAEMFRGTGVSMGLGFELNQQNTQLVRTMLNQGNITRETIGQAGGENALAQQMTANALSFTQTAYGRGLMMANFNQGTGTLNPNLALNAAGGDVWNALSGAAQMGPAGILKFQAHQEEMISQMSPMQLQMMGIGGAMSQARTITQAYGGSFKDNFYAIQLRQGVSRQMVDAQMGLMGADPEKIRQEQDQAIHAVGISAAQEDIRNRFTAKRWWNAAKEFTVQPAQRALTSLSTTVGIGVDNLGKRLLGAAVVDASGITEDSLKRGAAALYAVPSSRREGTLVNIEGSLWNQMVGGQSGSALAGALSHEKADADGTISFMGGKARELKTKAEAEKYARDSGERVLMLREGDRSHGYLMVRESEMMKMSELQRVSGSTGADINHVDEALGKGFLSDDKLLGLAKMTGGMDEAGKVLFGKAYDLRGKQGGYQRAMLSKVLQKHGSQKALDEINFLNGGALTGASAADAASAINSGKDKQDRLKIELRMKYGNAAFKDLDLDKFGDLLGLDTGSDQFATRLEDLGGREHSAEIREAVEGMSAGRRQEIRGRISEIDSLYKQGDTTLKRSSQSVAGNAVGQISKDAFETMTMMSTQLVKNMEILIAMQNRFKAAMGSK